MMFKILKLMVCMFVVNGAIHAAEPMTDMATETVQQVTRPVKVSGQNSNEFVINTEAKQALKHLAGVLFIDYGLALLQKVSDDFELTKLDNLINSPLVIYLPTVYGFYNAFRLVRALNK